MRIFLSYDFKTQRQFAEALTSELVSHGFSVWQAERRRRSAARMLGDWVSSEGEFGLNTWLRKGILASDLFILTIPYKREPDFVPDAWVQQLGISSADELIENFNREVNKLLAAYNGSASDKWDDPHQADQFGYFLFRPIHTFRMAWFEARFGVPLGKDPFEPWRYFETRVAGALRLPVVPVLLIEPEEDQFSDSVKQKLAQSRYNFVVVSRSALETDVRERLLPTIEGYIPTETTTAAINEAKRRLRRLHVQAKLTILACIGAVVGVGALIVKGIVALF